MKDKNIPEKIPELNLPNDEHMLDESAKPKLKPKKKWLGLINWFRAGKKTQAILVEMIHKNNVVDYFIVRAKDKKFIYEGKTYIFDPEAGVFNRRYKLQHYRFLEDHPEPLQIKHQKMGAKIDSSALTEVLEFTYAIQLIKANSIVKNIDLIMIMAGIGAVMGLINAGMILKLLGVF